MNPEQVVASGYTLNVKRYLRPIFYVGVFFVLGLFFYSPSSIFKIDKAEAFACTLTVTGNVNWNGAAWANCNSSYPGAGNNSDTATITTTSTGILTLDVSPAFPVTTLTINRPSNAQTHTLAMGANNLTVGTLALGGTTGGARLTTVTISTGALTVTNSITFAGVDSRITTTGAATINLTGTIGSGGTLSINSATDLVTTGTSALNGAYTWGKLTVNSGTTTLGGVAMTFAGATSVTGALANASNSALKTFTGAVTVNSGGSVDLTTGTDPAVTFAAGVTASSGAGSINWGTGTTTFSATQALAGSVNMTFGGAATINTDFTLTNNNTGIITFSSTVTGGSAASNYAPGSGSYTQFGNTVMATGIITPSTSAHTIEYNGGAYTVKVPTTNPYYHLILSGSGFKTTTSITTVTGNFTMSGTADASTVLTSIGGDFVVNGTSTPTLGVASLVVSGNLNVTGGTLTTGTSAFTVNGTTNISSGTVTITGATNNKTFIGLVTVSGGTLNGTSTTVVLRGGLTQTSGTCALTSTALITFDTNDQQINGTCTIPNITIASAKTVTNNGTVTVNTTMTLTGNWTQGSSSVLNLAGTTPFSGAGTFDASTNANTVNYTNGAQTVKAVTYSSLGLSGGGTKTMTSVTTVNANFSMSGTATTAVPVLTTIGGNLSVTGTASMTLGANLVVTGTTTIGDGTNASVFNQGATFNFTSGAVSVLASGSWTNTGTGDVTLAGDVSNTGAITLNSGNGSQCVDAANDIAVTSSVGATQRTWSGAGTFTLYNLSVTDMLGARTAYNSTFSNSNWVDGCGVVISGTIFTDEGSTGLNCGTSRTVALRVNGGALNEVECSNAPSNGSYSFGSIAVSAGAVITVYLNDESEKASVITRAADSSTNITGLNLYQNLVMVRHEDAGPITNTNLDQYDTDADVGFTVTSSNLTVSDGYKLLVWTGKTFTPGGTVTTDPSSSSSSADGDLMIQSSAVLSMGTNNLSIGGDFANIGTFSESASPHTTTLTATATGHTINPGTGNFENLTFNGAAGGWSFTDSTNTIDGDLTVTNGTLSGTSSLTVNGGDATGNGSINFTDGTFLLDGVGNFGGNSNWNFTNLTLGNGSGATTTTATGSGEIVVSGTITVASSQTLDAGSKNFELQHSEVTAGWWNTSWLNRRKITLNNAASAENLVNFPILVSLSGSNIDYSKTKDSGQDIRFVDADGSTQLAHEIENWNESGTSSVWVKIPQIDSGSTTDYIWVYYNNTGASDGQNVTGVWNADYVAVWHMNSSGTNVPDSTTNNTDGTKADSTHPASTSSGKVVDAQSFTADQSPGNQITTGFGSRTTFTAEFWFKPNNTDSYGTIIADSAGARPGIYTRSSNNGMIYYDGTEYFSNTGLTDDVWYHITVVRNGTSLNYYLNGVGDGNYTVSSSAMNLPYVGDNANTGEELTAVLDELRVSSIARSIDWVEASYNWSNNPTGFNTFAAEESSTTSIFVISGTFTSATSTFEFTSDSNTTIPNQSFYNVVFNNSGTTFTAPASGLAITNNLTITAGTFDLNANDPALTIKDMTNSDTLSASGSATLTVTGNWTNNGIFTHNSGTIEFVPGSTSTITSGGASVNVFHNFTVSSGAGKTLQFEAGDETKFEGTLTLVGTVDGPLTIDSTTSTQWELWATGSITVNRLIVKNSGCYTGTNTVGVNDTNINGGNNGTCWSLYLRGSGANSSEGSGPGGSGAEGGGGSGGGGGGSEGGSGGEGSSGGGSSGGGGGGASP